MLEFLLQHLAWLDSEQGSHLAFGAAQVMFAVFIWEMRWTVNAMWRDYCKEHKMNGR